MSSLIVFQRLVIPWFGAGIKRTAAHISACRMITLLGSFSAEQRRGDASICTSKLDALRGLENVTITTPKDA